LSDRLRLLICHSCETIEELPDYEGPPDYDDTLNYRVSAHRFGDGSEHFGVLATVAEEDWHKPSYQHEIRAKIADAVKPGSGSGMGDDFYNIKNTFSQDAMTCWRQHNRTRDCADWRTDAKRLYPDTRADRKAEGMDVKARPNTWLCDFCPVTSIYSQKRNSKRGDYN
jgi:hypothetical protein